MLSFWEWIEERQEITRRKNILDEDPPWTDDPIFQAYHFCNVHRRMDRGTEFYLDRVADVEDPDLLQLRTLCYRLTNKPETWRDIEDAVDRRDMEGVVEILRERSGSSWSPAYRVGGPNWTDYQGKAGQMYLALVRDEWLDSGSDLREFDGPEAAQEYLCSFTGVGSFLAYEILTDLNYVLLPWNENDWVSVGPGASKGLEEIYGEVQDEEEKVREMWREQEDHLSGDTWIHPDKDSLTLRDIEHSLCEYSKYRRAYEGSGSVRSR